MSTDPWPVTLPPINLWAVKPAYLLLTYKPPVPSVPMTAEQVTAWKKAVDQALWEAWRNNHILSIVHSRRRMN